MAKKPLKKRVIISVSNDLVTDQRVYKVSKSLIKFDYDVLLVGRAFRKSLPVNYDFTTKRFRLIFNKGPLFYASLNFRLFIFLLFKKADVFLSNDLDTLPANYLASKFRRVKLVYDSHEYFTEVPELVRRKKVKRFWEFIEKTILPKLKYSYTVCDSIADIYNKKYGINMEVIRNLPHCKGEDNLQKPEIFNSINKKILLYQGALNKGRGLESMIDAMTYINNAVLLIIGDGDLRRDLELKTKDTNNSGKILFLGKCSFKELRSYTKYADIGLSIEESIGLNYYYALPNKLFDYIHAKIPVLVSKLPEMEKIVLKYNVGSFIESHEAKHIADKVNFMLTDNKNIKIWKENLEIASKDLCWCNEETILKTVFDRTRNTNAF